MICGCYMDYLGGSIGGKLGYELRRVYLCHLGILECNSMSYSSECSCTCCWSVPFYDLSMSLYLSIDRYSPCVVHRICMFQSYCFYYYTFCFCYTDCLGVV